LLVLVCEIAFSIRLNSQTFDESVHLFSGYQYWRHRDFGANPEHPPLLKLVATTPLLFEELRVVPVVHGPTKAAHGAAGVEFLHRNAVAASRLLFETRMAASIFVCLLLVLVFLAGREMFGVSTGLVAATLLVFEPNVLANGPLITTDAALTAGLFATTYAGYRYVVQPSAWRLLAFGMAVACALASKHSAVLLAVILPATLLGELLVVRQPGTRPVPEAWRRCLVLGAVFVMAFIGLWAIYTFRYAARPGGADLSPALASYASLLGSNVQEAAIQAAARWHLLPESYLWGLTDVFIATEGRSTFLLGRVYPEGQWFYFPLVFGMKTTLAVLGLLLALPAVMRVDSSATGGDRHERRRVAWFLTATPVIWLAFSMSSGLNLGFRHILPIVPFVVIAAAAAAVALARRSAMGRWLAAALIVFHCGSSLNAFPNYLTYSNELVGGPRNTYRVMTDANADWGQGMEQAGRYIAAHDISDCWFVNRLPHVDLRDYGIPCRPLQAGIRTRVAPAHPAIIEGALFVSTNEINGQAWGPGELNPYGFLAGRRPDALIANSILLFKGRFDLSLAAASNRARRAQQLAADKRFDEALVQAQEALSMARESAEVQATICQVMTSAGRSAEAMPYCQEALNIADRTEPEYQYLRVPAVRAVAAMLRPDEHR
jgi:hypothetical protein